MTDSEREVPGLPTTLQQPVLRSRRCPRTVKRHDRKQLQRTCTQHDVEHRHKEMHYDKQQEYKNTFSYQKPTKQIIALHASATSLCATSKMKQQLRVNTTLSLFLFLTKGSRKRKDRRFIMAIAAKKSGFKWLVS